MIDKAMLNALYSQGHHLCIHRHYSCYHCEAPHCATVKIYKGLISAIVKFI